MARSKLPENKKKPKISITIDEKLSEIMEDQLNDLGINRSKYIENLIRKDIKERGLDITPDYEK
jgi:metal-responsive CopG/Arc/MetJ family transcriptional regulator